MVNQQRKRSRLVKGEAVVWALKLLFCTKYLSIYLPVSIYIINEIKRDTVAMKE